MSFRPQPGLFAVAPVLALIAMTALLISMGWPGYSWLAVAVLAGFAVASIRVEYLRWQAWKDKDHRPTRRR